MRKRMTAILLVAGLTAFSLTAFADEKDDRIQELEEQIVEMQQTIDDLQKQLDEAKAGETKEASEVSKDEYGMGETWMLMDSGSLRFCRWRRHRSAMNTLIKIRWLFISLRMNMKILAMRKRDGMDCIFLWRMALWMQQERWAMTIRAM